MTLLFDFLAAGIVIVVAALDGLQVPEEELEACPLTGMGLLIGDSGRRFRSLGNRCPGSCLVGEEYLSRAYGTGKACCKSF